VTLRVDEPYYRISGSGRPDEMAGVTEVLMCASGGMNGADDGCSAMAGHCLIA